jgi:hypothetical protein
MSREEASPICEVIPQAPLFERSVLATIASDPQRLAETPDLCAEHFNVPAHKNVFRAIEKLTGEGKVTDDLTLHDELARDGQLENTGGPAGVVDILAHSYPGSFPQHVAELRDYRARRLFASQAREIAKRVTDGTTAAELAEIRAQHAEQLAKIEGQASPSGFPLVMACDVDGATDPADFVEGLLTEGGTSVVYGPSNCGKSFWVMDLAVAVATGNMFRDELEAERGAVVYVALEGERGLRNRVTALKQSRMLPDGSPLFLCFHPVSLLEVEHPMALAATVKAAAAKSSLPCRLVVLDTLARAMAGGDENSGQDMTRAVRAMEEVRAATGAHVCLVHHCGKDEARGARGHSSLRAAVDTEIEVSRQDGQSISTVRVTKQRDLQAGEPMPFSLKVIELGLDRRGKPITSCVVKHEDSIMAASASKSGRKPTCAPEDMLGLLPAASVKDWQERVEEETGLKQSQFYEHKKVLEAGRKYRREAGTNRLIAS